MAQSSDPNLSKKVRKDSILVKCVNNGLPSAESSESGSLYSDYESGQPYEDKVSRSTENDAIITKPSKGPSKRLQLCRSI